MVPLIVGAEFPLGQWWPVFLAAAGLAAATGGNLRGGLAAIAAAAALLLLNLGVLDRDLSSLWPAALIVVGAAVLLRTWRTGADAAAAPGDELNVHCLFAGSRVTASEHFRGGRVTATCGEAEIDLRPASAVDGAVTVHASTLFGRIILRVPHDWAVDVRASVAFGTIESQRTEPAEPRARLTITGSSLFGGMLITS